MKVLMLDKEVELDNKRESVEEIISMINDKMSKGEYNFSHMIVDGEEIYDDFESYLEDNIKYISEVKLVMLTTKEIINDNLLTISEYIERAVPAINKLSDEFYKEPNVDDWRDIGDLFEGIAWILESFKGIDNLINLNDLVSNYETWNEYAKEVYSLGEFVEELEGAMENEDIILLADLMSYEIVPIFENMNDKLKSLLSI